VECASKLTNHLIQPTSTIQLELESSRMLKHVFSIARSIIHVLVSITLMMQMELVSAGFGLNQAMLVMEL
jgi:hypothetical protein